MRNLLLALRHLAVVTAKLCGPGGVRAVITASPEGARGRVYWLVFDVGKGNTVPGLPVDGRRGPEFRSTGVYEDVYAKTAEGWRIKSRTLNGDESR